MKYNPLTGDSPQEIQLMKNALKNAGGGSGETPIELIYEATGDGTTKVHGFSGKSLSEIWVFIDFTGSDPVDLNAMTIYLNNTESSTTALYEGTFGTSRHMQLHTERIADGHWYGTKCAPVTSPYGSGGAVTSIHSFGFDKITSLKITTINAMTSDYKIYVYGK